MTTCFTGSEMSLPKTKIQWHFPKLKYNGMRLADLAGPESPAWPSGWSGLGFPQQAGACWKEGESRTGSRWDEDGSLFYFLTIKVSVEAAEGKEAGIGQCRHCHTYPRAEARCIHCRCPEQRLPQCLGHGPHPSCWGQLTVHKEMDN